MESSKGAIGKISRQALQEESKRKFRENLTKRYADNKDLPVLQAEKNPIKTKANATKKPAFGSSAGVAPAKTPLSATTA